MQCVWLRLQGAAAGGSSASALFFRRWDLGVRKEGAASLQDGSHHRQQQCRTGDKEKAPRDP